MPLLSISAEVRTEPSLAVTGILSTLSLGEKLLVARGSQGGGAPAPPCRQRVPFLFYDRWCLWLLSASFISGAGTLDDLLHQVLVFVLMLPQLQELESLFLRAVSPLYPLDTLCVHFRPGQIVYQDAEPIRRELGRDSKPEEGLFAQGDICGKVENNRIHWTLISHSLSYKIRNKAKPTTKWACALSFLWDNMPKQKGWKNNSLLVALSRRDQLGLYVV